MSRTARHKAVKHKTPIRWKIRRIQNQWHAFQKPRLQQKKEEIISTVIAYIEGKTGHGLPR